MGKLPNSASTSSRASTSSESSGQNTIVPENKKPLNTQFLPYRFKLISLNSLTITLIIFSLQIYLIYNCFNQLKDLTSWSSISSSSSSSNTEEISTTYQSKLIEQKVNRSIIINASLITFAILFTIFSCVFSLFRLGVYSHDNFKLGKHFTNRNVVVSLDEEKKTITTTNGSPIASSSSINTSTSLPTSNSAMSKQKLTTKSILTFNYSSWFDCFTLLHQRNTSFWSELPPLGTSFHLMACFFLLLAQLQLNAKRIQISQKPIGDIFSTKLDFLIGEPIVRLEKLNLIKNIDTSSSVALKKRSDSAVNSSDLWLLNEIIHAKDDFSIFDNQYSPFSLTAVSNAISLDYLNYLIALVLFTVKIAQTFWFTSRKFTFLLFFNFLIISIQMSFSYCSFEILFKANNLKLIANQFILSNGGSGENGGQLNESTDYRHDLTIFILYTLSSILLFTSGYLNCKLGYRKFEIIRLKFEKSIGKYMLNNGVIINLNTTLDENCKSKLDDLNTITTITEQKTTNNSENNKENFFSNYKENLISSFLFIIYCIIRFLFIYELHILYKFTRDSFLIICISIELITILIWILTLILLAIKSEWKFKIDSNYKLTYWNWLYFSINNNNNNSNNSFIKKDRRNNNNNNNHHHYYHQHNQISGHVTNSGNSEIKCSYSLNPDLLNQPSTLNKKENDYIVKKINNDVPAATIAPNPGTNIGLLVRDDSVLLNRSSNLSSSSITEVSSLLPSACNNLMNSTNQSFNSDINKHKTNSATILTPSSLIANSSNSLNSKQATNNSRQFKINTPKNLNACFSQQFDTSKYFISDNKSNLNSSKLNFNTNLCKSNNEIVLIEEEEIINETNNNNNNNSNEDNDEYYKRLNRSEIFESDDSEMNNNSNEMIKEYNAYIKNQETLNNNINSFKPTTTSVVATAYNSSNNISFRASKNNTTTVGEIMDGPSLSVRDSRQVAVATTNSALHKAIGSLNKIINNDTNSSSVSTTDSGRDSLVDSPVNQNAKIQIHHQLSNVNSSNNHIKSLSYLQQQQHHQHKQQLLNTASMTTPSSCVSVSIDMNSAGSNSNLKMNTSSNFSDDCC